MTTIGQRITELREQAGMNRPKLAREADVSYSFLVQVETGQRENPQADKLAKVAKALGVSLDSLMSTQHPLPKLASADVADLRVDLIALINSLDEVQLRAAAQAIDSVVAVENASSLPPKAKRNAPSNAQS